MMWLYPYLILALQQYQKASVKFSCRLLIELAQFFLFDPTSLYTIHSRDPKNNKLLSQKLIHNLVQQFMRLYNIIFLIQRGQLTYSSKKMQTTHHLGVLQKGFESGLFDENLMENVDETHFVVNLDNGHTLGFKRDTTMKYAEVVSGENSMIIVIKNFGGQRSMMKIPMLIFTNPSSNYPIPGLEDNILRICYRTSPKDWMDQFLIPKFFAELMSFQAEMYGGTKIIWLIIVQATTSLRP